MSGDGAQGLLHRCAAPLLVAQLALAMAVVTAAPADAHIRAQASSSYRSDIVSAPDIEGVTWRMYAGGDLIEVVNEGPHELVVLGYEGEPYLRIGPEGVFENRRSPATYLNTERYADVAVPPRADATAAAEWTRVADGPARAWHDHRVHWMSPTPPPAVREARDREVHVFDWSVEVLASGERHRLTGELRWIEQGPWWPWLLAGLALTAPVAAGLRHRRSDDARQALLRPTAAGVALVALLNALHLPDELLAWPAPALDIIFGLFHTALFVGVGLAGAAIAWQGRQGPVLALGIASGAVAFHQGLLQTAVLTSSQLPTIWPDALLRVAVAASIAQAVWVTVVIAAARRHETAARLRFDRPDHPDRSSDPQPHKETL